ncbi:MAG TPA: filamentous hemagglutinin N-terminal domain-containing protein, partial [Marinagarivorans sp.]|nr:filamentous hemagglutinin N-terminal domain-containing protein [Marinagarivorans sp.]
MNSDERVQFIQPNSSSIAFNRILSNKGSLIQGRIDANGQVVLINPHGLIFTEGASVNAGGLIASALQMSDQDYLNGSFTLNALEGSEGRVINSGLLNAATGGTISLLGQSVENKGLISAQLGSVNLAAGKEAVLTFGPNGLVGVRVTQAVLQKELGVDAAIVNSGEINAEGGKVLITASTSKDIFSKAVNVGELSPAKSAVVNDDGSFTLRTGADIKNTGAINVGADAKAGEVVLTGENISNQGSINADSQTTHAGSVEITAKNINETKDNGTVTAVAHNSGKGGDIKLLGDKVGLLDNANIDVSGTNGGGQILVGGDKTGTNPFIQNAQFVYVDEGAHIKSNAIERGDGGRLIAFAADSATLLGQLEAKGGHLIGNGGFIETSGLYGLVLYGSPTITAANGLAGEWLIDPFDLSISDASTRRVSTDTQTFYTSSGTGARVFWDALENVLSANGAIVTIRTGGATTSEPGNITFDYTGNNPSFNFVFDNVGNITSTLKLNADGDIKFSDKISGLTASVTNNNRLNLDFTAGGDIDLNKVAISTNGGYFTAAANGTQKLSSNPDVFAAGDFKAVDASISTYGAFGGGDIRITTKGKADLGAMDFSYYYDNGNTHKLTQVGSINVTAGGDIILNKNFDFNNSGGYAPDGTANNVTDTTALTLSADGSITLNGVIADKEYGDGRDALGINVEADHNKDGIGSVTINQPIYTAGGSIVVSGAGIIQNALINTDRANERIVVEQANGKNGNATRSEGGNVTFSSDTDVTLNAITTDSFCTLGTCTGNWMVQSRTAGTKINIAQADNTHLTIHGTTDFTINGGTINLGNRDNIFGTQGGSVEAQAGNAVSKTLTLGTVGNTTVSGLGLLLGAADINGTARLTATSPTASVNAITQAPNTSLTVTGSTELTANTIALENNGNDFSIINSLDAATSVRVFDSANDLVLNTLKTPNLTLNTLGDAHFNGTIITNDKSVSITQNGAGAVALADSLTQAGTGAVTFNGTVLSAGFKLLSNQNAAWDLAAKTLVWDSKTFGFEGFTRLIGGAGVDTVRLSTSVNAIDLDNQSSTGFVLSNMEVIKATAANASLKGFKANSQWTITGDKKGTIVGGGQTTAFEGFNELISSDDASNTDLFTFNSAGAIGKITGQNADVVNLFPGTDGAGVDYDWAVTANTLNGSTTASAQVKRSGQSTDVIAALTGVGTINSSDGKDTVTASATYAGTIDLKAGVNALTTDSARLLFSSRPLNMNGFVGVNDLNAKTQAATLTASTDDVSAILAWAVNPAEDALKGPLSGSITYAQSGQADQTLSFKGFATLTGGANNDYFTLNNVALNTGTFTGGQINAGTPASAATQDRLINAVDGTVWDLSTASLRGVTFSGFNYWQG